MKSYLSSSPVELAKNPIDAEDTFGAVGRSFQKPKHMWMAKDMSLIQNLLPKDTCNSDSRYNLQCPIATSEAVVPQHLGNFTNFSHLPNGYAIGSPAILSSLTNTSSSPSSHTPLQSANGLIINEVDGHCTNFNPGNSLCSDKNGQEFAQNSYAFYDYNPDSKKVFDLKNKNKQNKPRNRVTRGGNRAPTRGVSRRSKIVCTKKSHKFRLNISSKYGIAKDCEGESLSKLVTNEGLKKNPVLGGLKIRLRRDTSLQEPVCTGKKSKYKKVNSTSAGVFRIVESWCDADAPGGEISQRALAAEGQISPSPSLSHINGGFRVGDLVWAKLSGYPYWPSRISALWARTHSQRTLVDPQFHTGGDSSLSVLATPSDPSMVSGFTARVDWLEGDKFSYLGCSKLYPFSEWFDKFYSRRTRYKGYTDAIKLAKQIVFEQSTGVSTCMDLSHVHQGVSVNVTNNDSDLPTIDFMNSRERLRSSHCISDFPKDISFIALDESMCLPELPFSSDYATFQRHSCHRANVDLRNHINVDQNPSVDLSQGWAPLPQLDISGLGDIISHIPTFSDDEDGSSSCQFKIPLSPGIE